MKIIIEGYQYQEDDVKSTLKGFEPFTKDGKISIDYVGYFYSKEIADCIFFLPKVILNENDEVFGNKGVKPENIIDLYKAKETETLSTEDHKFISNFSVWIYRAIREFYRLNDKSEILLHKTFSRIDSSSRKVDGTLLDIVLELIRFNRENQDFFMYIIKNVHSGYNKINWNKTISQRTPFLQNKSQIYINPINKKKQINFDEELIVIFFSILNHINVKYGFKTPIHFNYELIRDNQFENYLRGFGMVRLRQIKFKYFSDKALLLWKLCYSFFELSEKINSSDQQSDYLLARNFNIIFEAIIDELISDKNILKELKEQKDGKTIDHIYRYQSLLNENEIYYIGDSKYYKIGAGIGDNSIYKQYTYAKNVIQYNFDLFFNGDKRYVRYRDKLTEGYNITPNFFISAEIKERTYTEANLKLREEKDTRVKNLKKHFRNRLFDRDTLWLSHYDINFLFVVALYAQSNDAAKADFKAKAQKQFREHIISLLNKEYEFSILDPKGEYSLQRAIDINFKRLYGKVFCPSENEDVVIMALDKEAENQFENAAIKKEIKEYFFITENYQLGEDVNDVLLRSRLARRNYTDAISNDNFYDLLVAEPEAEYTTSTINRIFTDSAVNREYIKATNKLSDDELPSIVPIEDELVLVGYYNDDVQLKAIAKSQLYYVRTGFRNGSIQLLSGFEKCKYLFLHKGQKQVLLKLKGIAPKLYTGKQLSERGFMSKNKEESYLGFIIDSTDPIAFKDKSLNDAIIKGIGNRKAVPYFTTMKDLFQIK